MSLNPGDYALILLVIAASVAAGAYFFRKTELGPAGVVRANDFTDEKIRQAIMAAVKGVDVSKVPAEEAEELLEEIARHAIARTYAQIYPGHRVEVTPHWPDAKCVITENIAVIRPWVGHRVIGQNGIRPVKVEVNIAPTLHLTTAKPIRQALDEMITGPVKPPPPPALQKAQVGQKPSQVQPVRRAKPPPIPKR